MADHSNKTILFYTDTPIIGGAENQMYLLAKFLNKDKFKVVLICSNYKQLDDWAHKFENEEIEVQRVEVSHKHDPRHYYQLKDLIKKLHVDLFHVHVWNPASCRYALMIGQKYNIPIIITEHDPFELSKFKMFLKRRLMKGVDHIIAVSEANKRVLQNMFPEIDMTAIHNGIDVTWFESQNLSFSEKDIEDYRSEVFEADPNTKIILSVAELHERKGLNHLISALKIVLENEKNCKLVIAGMGPDKDKLEKQAEDEDLTSQIKFLGFRKDIPHLMKASDIFVLPSIKEAFGLVLLEAMVAKLAIVASKVGGIPEIIKDGENGLLVDPHDEDKIAGAILKIFENKDLAEKFTTTGFELIKKQFDAKSMAKETEKIYDRILSQN